MIDSPLQELRLWPVTHPRGRRQQQVSLQRQLDDEVKRFTARPDDHLVGVDRQAIMAAIETRDRAAQFAQPQPGQITALINMGMERRLDRRVDRKTRFTKAQVIDRLPSSPQRVNPLVDGEGG